MAISRNQSAAFLLDLYKKGAGILNELASALRLPQLINWLSRRLGKNAVLLGFELFVALSLSICFYYLIKPVCRPKADGGQQTGFMFCSYMDNTSHREALVPPAWKTRVAAPALTAQILKLSKIELDYDSEPFQRLFGLYNTTWLALTFAMLIWARRDALLILLGVFGGLMYYFSDPAMVCYPWDLPSLFFFTAAILLFDAQKPWLLMSVVCLGGLFKETTLCCAILILFLPRWPLKYRVFGFIMTVWVRMILNKLLMNHYGVQVQSLAMGDATSYAGLLNTHLLLHNVKLLFEGGWRNVIFVNAGAWLAALLVPWHNRRDIALKLVLFVFIFGQFFYGIITEFRIWYEILPLGWMIVSECLQRNAWPVKAPAPAAAARAANKPDGVWLKASHWLTVTGLVYTALALLLVAVGKHAGSQAESNNIAEEQSGSGDKSLTAEEQYRFGVADQNRKDFDGAIGWYQKAAQRGNLEAENRLGVLLSLVQHDDRKAVYWLGEAAARGDADAENNLGSVYLNGRGVTENDAIAAQFYLKAARQGNVSAQRALGEMYRDGAGVTADPLRACKWLALAALPGDEATRQELMALEATMTKEQLETAENAVKSQLPIQQFSPAAQKGDLESQYQLGVAYHNDGDDDDAILWLQRAALRGDAQAQNELGILFQARHDDQGAVEWLTQSAAQGFLPAQVRLGRIYQQGTGVKIDKPQAYHWLKLASLQGDTESQADLQALTSAMTPEQIAAAEKWAGPAAAEAK